MKRAPHACRSRLSRGWPRVVLAALLCSTAPGFAADASNAAVGEYQVKAAFLYHFSKFVEWPDSTRSELLVVGILGEDPFGPLLDFTFQDKSFEGKRFEIRRLDGLTSAKQCHILFISETDSKSIRQAVQNLAGLPVLTVGDSPEFAAAGGMIQLLVEGSKVRFDINLTAAKSSGLRISSQLLRLARKVENK